jgi:quercetin dioxygenase-like cupin family protein
MGHELHPRRTEWTGRSGKPPSLAIYNEEYHSPCYQKAPDEGDVRMLRVIIAFLLASTIAASAAEPPAPAMTTKVTPLTSKDLEGIPGKEGSLFLVEYPPGGSDPVHRHNASVFVYVLEGSIVMQARGGKEVTLTKGETFFESPEDVHVVGRNASQTEPAKFLAFFVKDKGAPVVLPAQ